VPVVYYLHHFLHARGLLLLEALDLDSVVRVLHYLQLLLVIQQVYYLPAVDFVEGHGEGDCALVGGEPEEVLHGLLSISVYGEGLARARLTVREQSHHTPFENGREQRLDLVVVDVL